MKVGSLFAGIGGFDLAASRVWGWDCVRWQVEIDPWAQRVLAKHWPDVQRFGDIRELTGDELEPVDLVCGGFPCQDISLAGKGAGLSGERSGLWSEYARLVGKLRPRYVVVENSPALLDRGIERVLGDLAALGFDAEWHCIPAAAIGAPHIRDRVWVCAYAPREQRRRASREAGHVAGLGGEGRGLGNAFHFQRQPRVGRMADGVPGRVDRIRGLGNAIVPQVAEQLFRWISEAEGC